MATTTGPLLPYKVWSADRRIRIGAMAASYSDLEAKCREKFHGYVACDQPLRFVLDSDGTQVDQDFFTIVEAGTVLILLRPGEEWQPQGPVQPAVAGQQPATTVQPYTTAAPANPNQGYSMQPVPSRKCPGCGAEVTKSYTGWGIILAVLFFPLGILPCLLLQEWRCQNCDRKWQESDYYNQCKSEMDMTCV